MATTFFCSQSRDWGPGLAKGHPCPPQVTPQPSRHLPHACPRRPSLLTAVGSGDNHRLARQVGGTLAGVPGAPAGGPEQQGQQQERQEPPRGAQSPQQLHGRERGGAGDRGHRGTFARPVARHGTARVPLLREGAERGQQSGWSRQEGEARVHLWNSANSLLECQDCQTVLGGVRRGDWHTWQGIIRGIDANHGMAPQHQPLLGTELLKASAPARVVNVSSFRHSVGTADSGYLTGQRRPGGHDAAYNSTKLMNVLFTAELARRLQGTGVTANALSPGVVGTSIMRHFSRPVRALFALLRPFMKVSGQGAASTIFCAISEEAEGISGKYFDSSCRLALPSELARDAALARKLWEASERLTGLSERG
uniref:Uncharacterized protein n=1 Tax=Junco hyemalis TaxID=40217 RepID=A0A8C5IMD2_JUNHY